MKRIIIILLIISIILEVGYFIFWYKKIPAVYTIGISQWNDNIELLEAIQGFKQGLAEFGFQEGKNIKFIIIYNMNFLIII